MKSWIIININIFLKNFQKKYNKIQGKSPQKRPKTPRSHKKAKGNPYFTKH